MKREHAPIAPVQLQAMQHVGSALAAMLRQAGAAGIVFMVDWGHATTIAAVVADGADMGTVFPRLVAEAPERVADWARRVEEGNAQILAGERTS